MSNKCGAAIMALSAASLSYQRCSCCISSAAAAALQLWLTLAEMAAVREALLAMRGWLREACVCASAVVSCKRPQRREADC